MRKSQLLDRARAFSEMAHVGQTYDSRPYVFHLDQVVAVLEEFGFGGHDHLLAAGYLHDVLEDTNTTVLELWNNFPSRVVDLVCNVTNEPGPNRLDRFLKTAPKIKSDGDSVILKLADRIANVRYSMSDSRICLPEGVRLYRMYQNEYPIFRHSLYNPDSSTALRIVIEPMWQCLAELV